jgi:uncharacterized cupin superfamily protein
VGTPTLVTDAGQMLLEPGMCAAFKSGTGDAHHLVNRADQLISFLEVGDGTEGDRVSYPADDLAAVIRPEGKWRYLRKDGTPY